MPIADRSEAGFTLMEMLCTCSILGIVLALAIPDMTYFIDRTTQVQLSMEIKNQLKHAQLLAMATEAETVVQLSNKQMIVKQNQQTVERTTLPQGLKIMTNYPHDEIRFQETGQVRGGTITIFQQHHQVIKLVIQVATGTTKVVVNEAK